MTVTPRFAKCQRLDEESDGKVLHSMHLRPSRRKSPPPTPRTPTAKASSATAASAATITAASAARAVRRSENSYVPEVNVWTAAALREFGDPIEFPDDPVQSMDDVHIAQFAALQLRTLAKGTRAPGHDCSP